VRDASFPDHPLTVSKSDFLLEKLG